MLPGLNFGGGGEGGFDFGDFAGGSVHSGPTNIDARTTTGGGDPELIGQLVPTAFVIGAVIVAFFAFKKFKG